MSVEIDPLELGFRRRHFNFEVCCDILKPFTGPFTGEVTQTLKIKNPNHTPVAFKVFENSYITY
jgi:hypothetical protein